MMLLTQTIKNSRTAIEDYRKAQEKKQSTEDYSRALVQLNGARNSVINALHCAKTMKDNGIITEPILDSTTKKEILNCIDDCGNGISENSLTVEMAKLLQSNGEAFANEVKVAWSKSAEKYAQGVKGYLSMISGLTEDPVKSRELSDRISQTVSSNPTVDSALKLKKDVSAAKVITDSFALNPSIEGFLKKVSDMQATVSDLTPDVATWLQEKKLKSKLKIKF